MRQKEIKLKNMIMNYLTKFIFTKKINIVSITLIILITSCNKNSNSINDKLEPNKKSEIITKIFREKTIEERDKLNRTDLRNFIIEYSTDNFSFVGQMFKDGDIVILFDEFNTNEKLKNNWYLYNTRKAISQKKPFLVVFTKDQSTITGNRFADGGLTEKQVGFTYKYGYYKKDLRFSNIRFVYFEHIGVGLAVDEFGYISSFEKNNSGWSKEYEGLYNFTTKENYIDTEDNNYFKKNIISKIYSDSSKFMNGIIKNKKIVWNNNNNIHLLFDDIEH